jgi:4-hydroxy-tetrahydrodipicolinate reductase
VTHSPLRVAVTAAAGRMGRRLVALGHQGEGTVVTVATEASGHGQMGHDAGAVAGIGPIGVTLSPDLAHGIGDADVVIDFSTPEATVAHAKAAGAAKVPVVVGTTGLSAEQLAGMEKALAGVAWVQAPNMSVGVNVLFRLLELAVGTLGEAYDVEIVETHHRHKVDAPSGTALALGAIAARAKGVDFDSQAVYARHGRTGPRRQGTIGLQSLRVGDVVGDHTVVLGTDGERLELTHRAQSRDTFALGALRAARWVATRPPGRYDMQDVLGLR